MTGLEPLNRSLFLLINAAPSTPAWRIQLALLVANKLILLAPGALTALWLWGGQDRRNLALKLLAGIGAALCLSYLAGALWPQARPFMLGLGHAYFTHRPSPAFPSNHTLIIATLALTLIFERRGAGWGWAALALAVMVGLSRVYLGVHFPLDIAGGLLLALAAAGLMLPVWQRIGAPLTARLQTFYRKWLAWPIARGWIRA